LIDGGQIRFTFALRGPRIESTEAIFKKVEDKIAKSFRPTTAALIIDNIGLPARDYNLACADEFHDRNNDGISRFSMKEGHSRPPIMSRKCVRCCRKHFPESTFYFHAADMLTQILISGRAGPQIDVPNGRLRQDNSVCKGKIPSTPCAIPACRCASYAAGSRRPGVLRPDRPDSRGSAWLMGARSHRHQCSLSLSEQVSRCLTIRLRKYVFYAVSAGI